MSALCRTFECRTFPVRIFAKEGHIKKGSKQDASGLLQSMHQQDGTSLLEAKNLGNLIRHFISRVLDSVAASAAGSINQKLGAIVVQERCRHYARQMTGAEDCAFTIDGKWFPSGAVKFLRSELGIKGDDDEVVLTEAWARVALRVFESVKLPTEAEQQSAIEELIQSALGSGPIKVLAQAVIG